jgi:AAT family amino acid transporter/GABA permease
VLASVASPQRLFTFLVNASGAIMLVVYLLIALAQIRQRQQRAGRHLVIRMWLYPWLSYATVAGIVLVLASMLFRPAERVQLAASALSVAVVLAAFWWKRTRGA